MNKRSILIVSTSSFVIGASMELFMIKTGFYDIVTRKESERQLERKVEQDRQSKRMEELKAKYNIKD
jgi:hypothetical protein